MAKFRSWNEALNKFLYFEDGRYFNETISMFEDNYNLFNWKNAEQLLFKDTQPEEKLYENDKARLEFNITNLGKIERKSVIGIVCNDESGIYIFSEETRYYLTDFLDDWRGFELKVIGNIHE